MMMMTPDVLDDAEIAFRVQVRCCALKRCYFKAKKSVFSLLLSVTGKVGANSARHASVSSDDANDSHDTA